MQSEGDDGDLGQHPSSVSHFGEDPGIFYMTKRSDK